MRLGPLLPPSRFETIIINHLCDPASISSPPPLGHEHYERKNAFGAAAATPLVAIHRAGFVIAPPRLRRPGGDHRVNGDRAAGLAAAVNPRRARRCCAVRRRNRRVGCRISSKRAGCARRAEPN